MDSGTNDRVEAEIEAVKEKPLKVRKIKIKFEGRKRESVHGDEGFKEDDNVAPIEWICKLCSKKFGSAKGLGGHTRVHRENNSVDGVNGDYFGPDSKFKALEKDGTTCSFCGKSFPSLKSLCGHMKCHPERDWRGMIPPENSSPSSTISSDQAVLEADQKVLLLTNYEHNEQTMNCSSSGVDLANSVRVLDGWSVKRRRTDKNSSIAVSNQILDENEFGAVQGFMLLATGLDCYKFHDLDDDKDSYSKYCKKNHEIGDEEDQIPPNQTIPDVTADVAEVDAQDQNSSDELSALKTRKRKSRIEPTASTSAVIKCYKCSICYKEFSTPQALGGHKSSAHSKFQITAAPVPNQLMLENGPMVRTDEQCDDHQENDTIMMINNAIVPLSHICKVCNKAFTSGQALGGHMRKHYIPVDGSSSSNSSPTGGLQLQLQLALVSSDQQTGSPPTAASVDDTKESNVGFDLNEFPAED